MGSPRRLIANLGTIGKIYQSKKHPERLHLLFAFGKKGEGHKFGGYFQLRQIPTDSLQNIIVQWVTPAYEASMDRKPDPYSGQRFEEEHIRIVLDLCYKELARRAEKVHK